MCSNLTSPHSHSKTTSHTLRFLNDLLSDNDAGMGRNNHKNVAVVDQLQLGATLVKPNDKLECLRKLDKSNHKECTEDAKGKPPNSVATTCQP